MRDRECCKTCRYGETKRSGQSGRKVCRCAKKCMSQVPALFRCPQYVNKNEPRF